MTAIEVLIISSVPASLAVIALFLSCRYLSGKLDELRQNVYDADKAQNGARQCLREYFDERIYAIAEHLGVSFRHTTPVDSRLECVKKPKATK